MVCIRFTLLWPPPSLSVHLVGTGICKQRPKSPLLPQKVASRRSVRWEWDKKIQMVWRTAGFLQTFQSKKFTFSQSFRTIPLFWNSKTKSESWIACSSLMCCMCTIQFKSSEVRALPSGDYDLHFTSQSMKLYRILILKISHKINGFYVWLDKFKFTMFPRTIPHKLFIFTDFQTFKVLEMVDHYSFTKR